jgi:hypothetical protein
MVFEPPNASHEMAHVRNDSSCLFQAPCACLGGLSGGVARARYLYVQKIQLKLALSDADDMDPRVQFPAQMWFLLPPSGVRLLLRL